MKLEHDQLFSTGHKNTHYALSFASSRSPTLLCGLDREEAFAAAGRGGFALAAAATIVPISARHSLAPVASSSRIAGMREKTHSRKAIRKLGTEYIVDYRGLGRRTRAIPQSLDDTSTDELRNS